MYRFENIIFSTGLMLTWSGLVLSQEAYLNKCMKQSEEYSKDKPAPEPGLECPSFSQSSCCSTGATVPFLSSARWQDYNYAPCPQKSTLAPACKQRFFDQLCFSLCSPDLGPWIEVDDETGNERLQGIPVCESECNKWWWPCQNEITCASNWAKGFDKSSGTNQCMAGSECLTYTEQFGNAKTFCESIWDGAFKVVPDTETCMQFTYSPGAISPNRKIAEEKAKTIGSRDNVLIYTSQMIMVVLGAVIYKANRP